MGVWAMRGTRGEISVCEEKGMQEQADCNSAELRGSMGFIPVPRISTDYGPEDRGLYASDTWH